MASGLASLAEAALSMQMAQERSLLALKMQAQQQQQILQVVTQATQAAAASNSAAASSHVVDLLV